MTISRASVALCIVLVVASPAQARTLVDAGVARVDGDLSATQHCALPVDADLCPVGYDNTGTLQPGDDTITTSKSIDDVTLRSIGPLPGMVVEPDQVTIENPAFTPLNATWKQLNDTLPPAVREFVTLDSRGMTMVPDSWGPMLVLHLPLHDPARELLNWSDDNVYIGVICWNLVCGVTGVPYLVSNETAIHVAPDNVFLFPADSDGLLEQQLKGSDGALGCQPWMTQDMCPVMADARSDAAPVALLAESLTPNVQIGFQFNRTGYEPESAGAPINGTALNAHATPPREDAALGVHGTGAPLPPKNAPVAPFPNATPQVHTLESETTGLETVSGALDAVASRVPTATAALLAATFALAGLAGWLLHRITRERALDQTNRRRLFKAIQERPGSRVGTLASDTGLSYKTALNHVLMLEHLGLVHGTDEPQRRFFITGQLPHTDELLLTGPLSSPAARSVWSYLQQHREADLPTIHRDLGMSKSTVSEILRDMVHAGLLTRRRVNVRVVVCVAAPAALAPPVALAQTSQPAA